MKELQQMRYSTVELSLIKNTFAENQDLLKILRKHFLQLPLTENETNQLHNFSPEILKLLRRFFLPTLEGDEPLNQIIDLWMTVNLQDKNLDMILVHVTARRIVINYLEQQLSILEDKDIKLDINFKDFINPDVEINKGWNTYSNLIARNTIVQHVEQQLTQIYLLAGTKDETTEQTLERLKKNSNK